jgi:flagellar operon protein
MSEIKVNPNLQPVSPAGTGAAKAPAAETGAKSFQQFMLERLQQQAGREKVTLSAHASERLKSRNLELNPQDMENLEKAVDRAAAKGAKDSLVMLKNLALVVNIKNRVVITAMDGNNLKENVITNIDSALII